MRSGRPAWLLLTVAMLARAAGPPLADGVLAPLLPPAPAGYARSAAETGPADAALFGLGTSTRARYTRSSRSCTVTITGGSPNMQGIAMTFSNPAVAGFTGNDMARIGSERVLVRPDGELQVFANNFLVQVAGDCPADDKRALVAATDVNGLRALAGAGAAPPAAATRGAIREAGPDRLRWERTFGGPASDWSYALTGTRDGGVAAAGRTESQGAGREDLWVVRIDASGERLWDRALGGAAVDRARAVIETRDGGIVVAGATESRGAGEFDVWVLKLAADGTLLWERTFGGPGADWASAIVETRDGGLAVAAYTQDSLAQPFDAWIIRLTATGGLRWQQRLGGPAEEWASAITEALDGDLVVAGHTESKGAGNADLWVLKLARGDGRLRWDATFGGAGRDYASAVAMTRDGDILLAGPTDSWGAGLTDAWVLRLDGRGRERWGRTFGGARDDWPRAIRETRDGRFAISGYTSSQGAGEYDMWLLRLERDGTLRAESTFGGPANEWARSLVELPDGDLAMAGDTWSQGAGMADVWVVRVESAR